MEPDGRPFDVALLVAAVLRALDDIDASGEDERDTLLSDLVCAAWGSAWALGQCVDGDRPAAIAESRRRSTHPRTACSAPRPASAAISSLIF